MTIRRLPLAPDVKDVFFGADSHYPTVASGALCHFVGNFVSLVDVRSGAECLYPRLPRGPDGMYLWIS